MLHLEEGEGEAQHPDSPDAPPSPAALTYLLQGPCVTGLGSVLPTPHKALETAPASLAAPNVCSPLFSLVPAGRLSELVRHHFSREVVQIQHVLEEGIFRDFILWE